VRMRASAVSGMPDSDHESRSAGVKSCSIRNTASGRDSGSAPLERLLESPLSSTSASLAAPNLLENIVNCEDSRRHP
jgi:hypothetical protein